MEDGGGLVGGLLFLGTRGEILLGGGDGVELVLLLVLAVGLDHQQLIINSHLGKSLITLKRLIVQ